MRRGKDPGHRPASDRAGLCRGARRPRHRDRGGGTLMRPLPVGLVCGALLSASVAADHPFVLAACAAGSLALLLAAGGPAAPYLWFAGASAVLVFAVNPFVAVQGLTPLWHGPHVPLLDTEITQEELAYGAAAALRIA